MNSSDARFRINALIQMARTTDNQDKREEYISQAEKELDEMCQSPFHDNSMEQFFNEKCEIGEQFRTDRTEIYKKYIEFCEECSFCPYSRNALYRYFRENRVRESHTANQRYFKLKVVD